MFSQKKSKDLLHHPDDPNTSIIHILAQDYKRGSVYVKTTPAEWTVYPEEFSGYSSNLSTVAVASSK